jgi:hypothetical protein
MYGYVHAVAARIMIQSLLHHQHIEQQIAAVHCLAVVVVVVDVSVQIIQQKQLKAP